MNQFIYLFHRFFSLFRDWKTLMNTGSATELTYMATVLDLPYQQHQASIPRIAPIPPLEIWDDLRTSVPLNDGGKFSWSSIQNQQTSSIPNHQSKVRIMDIIDTKHGISGQIDSYLDSESAYYPTTTMSQDTTVTVDHSIPIDSELNFSDSHDLSTAFDIDTSGPFLTLDF